jgi:guanosine-3',5'-bis(diphosphate) 3'-pyrophosphohydrolase
MMLQHKEINEIFDLTAIRIIVNDIKDCYAVLGAIHTKWTPIPGRFKDFIAMPKSNRYQSIHTTVFSESGAPFEIQIRTAEMHRIAEYGVAAHWKYKERITGDSSDEEIKLSWIRQTLEWQKDIRDSKEFLETLKVDLFSGQVFVFTPKGDVIELPKGATPLDFAYKIHSGVGESCVGARVNGKMVPITYELQTGEIVDIVTSNNSRGPNIDWLKIVKTNSARNKIRQYLKKKNQVVGTTRGKELLEKACIKKDLDPAILLTEKYIERAAKKQNFPSVNDLYAALSAGGALISKTLLLCISYHRETEAAALRQQERDQKRLEARANKARTATKGIKVKGVENLLVRFARCCNPVPGDEIIGYTTKGRGVSIHRLDCINMLSVPEEQQGRLIEVSWELSEGSFSFEAGLTILADDRKGLFLDISKVCDDMDISISSVHARSDVNGIATMNLLLSIANTGDIEKLISKLKQVKDVVDVYRSIY